MCNFTKGPWDWEHDNSTPSIIQVFSKSIETEGSPGICRLQHEPDAHLIASAPEMYEMLERFLPYSTFDENGDEVFHGGDFHWNEDDDPMIEELKQILAKARGEHV